MPLQPRLYTKDEELGKRDDDFRPKRMDPSNGAFNPLGWRKRRFLLVFLVVALLYLFFRNIPTDLGPPDRRLKDLKDTLAPLKPFAPKPPAPKSPDDDDIPPPPKPPEISTPPPGEEPTGPAPHTQSTDSVERDKHYYDGIIKFYRLAETLKKLPPVAKPTDPNRNVLFAAASLKSLANLLPMACEMARTNKNTVHVAVMGREDLSLDEVQSLNGLDKDDCAVTWHDARSDYSEYSTDSRLEAAVAGAMKHINDYMRPRAIIVDHHSAEDASFIRAMTRKSKDLWHPMIEIPANRHEEFLWISQLDSGSLSNWFTPSIDIIVHAPKASAGGLIRLMKSLTSASYAGFRLPKVTIELSTDIPPALRSWLSNFKWPARFEPATIDVDPFTVRHRVQTQRASSEQASMRFLESFYPAQPDNHVLLLSPQAELSPQYMQYLYYNLLAYRYSSLNPPWAGDLLGISLDVPSSQLNGEEEFAAPEIADDSGEKTPFLYQAPSSKAILIFGDKWAIFHDYLAHRITASHLGKATKTEKLVSRTEPSWMEYLLELMRARSWSVLHPAKAFVTVHNELAQLPEEYVPEETKPPGLSTLTPDGAEEPFLLAASTPTNTPYVEIEPANPAVALHHTLPNEGRLIPLDGLPFLNHQGGISSFSVAQGDKAEFVSEFRRQIGGCDEEDAARPRLIQDGTTDDLFCLPGVELAFDTQAEDMAAIAAQVADVNGSD